jgi:hypothetical protein
MENIMAPIIFNSWELQYLQQLIQRWDGYRGQGSFSDAEHTIISSIKTKVQVADGVPVAFDTVENNFLQSLLLIGKQDYGRGSGQSVFETGVRGQVQQRTVFINSSILAKLRGQPVPIVLPGETEALES